MRGSLVWTCLFVVGTWGTTSRALILEVVPVEEEGGVEIALPEGSLLADAEVGVVHDIIFSFDPTTNLVRQPGASTNFEFGFVNGSDEAIDYRVQLYEFSQVVFEGSVAAGATLLVDLPMTELPPASRPYVYIAVETSWTDGEGNGTFDFVLGGGAGDANLTASGPLRFESSQLMVGTLPRDVNFDDDVDLQDLFDVQNNFGLLSPPHRGDTDNDHDIDLTDLFNVLNYAAPPRAGVATIPEPAGIILVLLVAGLYVSFKQRYVK